MSVRAVGRTTAIVLLSIMSSGTAARAQGRSPLPPTRADSLLDEGRWSEAEALFYSQSERAPRSAARRAALGQFLAMKGAVRPGMVLIQEAEKFGLDEEVARELLAPLRRILEWRRAAAELKRDSTLVVRAAADTNAVFQIPLPRTDMDGHPIRDPSGTSGIVWHDVVDRAIGLDSLGAPNRPIGIEIFDGLAPSLNVRDNELTVHANSRSALGASGRRYQVLRTPQEVRVLMGDRRVLRLAEALRELAPSWWQLDLVHGILVVR